MTIQDARQLSKETQKQIRRLAVEAVVKHEERRSKVCELYKVSKQALSKWIKKYKKGGYSSLDHDKRGSGKKEKLLSPQQIKAVKEYIHNYTPDELDLPYLLWTREAVQKLIWQKYKIAVALKTLSTWLHDWGFSPQKPAKKAMEQNPELVRKWLEEEYPIIERRAKKEKAEITWVDESRIQSADNRGRSYAKKGETPSIKISARKNGTNFISTVNKLGIMRFMTYLGKMDSFKLIEFLSKLIRGSKKKIFVIMDNLSVHKSGKVREWVNAHQEQIEIFYLPTYSPDLNPDEYLNRHLKSVIFKEERPTSRESLRSLTVRKLRVIQSNKDLVKSYFDSKSVQYARAA